MSLSLTIRTLTGGTLNCEFPPSSPIRDVKKFIYDHEGIPPTSQRLAFAGLLLFDEFSLSDYRITTNSTLHLLLRLSSADDDDDRQEGPRFGHPQGSGLTFLPAPGVTDWDPSRRIQLSVRLDQFSRIPTGTSIAQFDDRWPEYCARFVVYELGPVDQWRKDDHDVPDSELPLPETLPIVGLKVLGLFNSTRLVEEWNENHPDDEPLTSFYGAPFETKFFGDEDDQSKVVKIEIDVELKPEVVYLCEIFHTREDVSNRRRRWRSTGRGLLRDVHDGVVLHPVHPCVGGWVDGMETIYTCNDYLWRFSTS